MSKQILAEEVGVERSLYSINVNTIRGDALDLKTFKGNVALVVNTASKCGFTSQYDGLEKLYQNYKEKGFVVLGFPSNDYGKQEPGLAQEIENFCKLNYGVTFPIFEKAPVSGNSKQEAYKILTEESNKELNGDPGWNFVKFLVDKNGFPRARFSSMTSPESKSISEEIEKLLAE